MMMQSFHGVRLDFFFFFRQNFSWQVEWLADCAICVIDGKTILVNENNIGNRHCVCVCYQPGKIANIPKRQFVK